MEHRQLPLLLRQAGVAILHPGFIRPGANLKMDYRLLRLVHQLLEHRQLPLLLRQAGVAIRGRLSVLSIVDDMIVLD